MVLLNSAGRVPDTEILLHTRAKRSIANTQAWHLFEWDWKQFGDLVRDFKRAKPVSDACPVYNCHGLTFGSRRTAVESEVLPILKDDGFEEIKASDVREGDIILYLDGQNGEVSHSGFVTDLTPALLGSSQLMPKIWSKWGKGPEMIHLVPDCPFYLNDEFIRYYRLTNWKEGWRAL